MTQKEHKDIYIASAVGGLGLVLIWLYLHGGTVQASITDPNAEQAAPLADTSPYNYNVAPYDPGPPLSIAFPPIPDVGGGSTGTCGCGCGPDSGGQYFNPNVAQYQTLIQ